jgi:hypothetical protein
MEEVKDTEGKVGKEIADFPFSVGVQDDSPFPYKVVQQEMIHIKGRYHNTTRTTP